MKIKLELFGASRDFSEKDYLEFNYSYMLNKKRKKKSQAIFVHSKFLKLQIFWLSRKVNKPQLLIK